VTAAETAALNTAWTSFFAAIAWEKSLGPGAKPSIGVVEDSIDWNNSWVRNSLDPLELSAAQGPRPAVTGADAGVREYVDDDHGTLVASIISASMSTLNGGLGLLPNARLVPLAPTFLANDVPKAKLNHAIKVLNLSFSQREPGQLLKLVHDHPDVLFVGAAGKEGGEIGVDVTNYPAMLGDQGNVIIVAGTNASGDSLLMDSGSLITNYGPKYVQLAAVGDGFHGAGRDWGYVPAHGSSFAVPQVTAIAALLAADGVTDPWRIKQRLISTAEPNSYGGKVLGGRLNAARAFDFYKEDMVCEATHLTCSPGLVDFHPINMNWLTTGSLTFNTGAKIVTVPSKYLRRMVLLPSGTEYRVVYQNPADEQRVEVLTVRADPAVILRQRDGPAIQMTSIRDFVGRIQ
jgi:subtilisin family serine protease